MVDPVLFLELGNVHMTGLACGYTRCCTLPLSVLLCMYGVCTVYVRCVCGVCGVCAVYVWCVCGVCMVYVRCMYGVCVVYVRFMCSVCTVYVRCMCGVCMVYLNNFLKKEKKKKITCNLPQPRGVGGEPEKYHMSFNQVIVK